MTKLHTYRGYTGVVEIDVEAGVLAGTVLGLRDIIHFEGTTVAAVTKAFHDSVDEYLAWCEELGQEPDKPYSGKVMVRMEPQVHRRLAQLAECQRTSVNSLMVSAAEALLDAGSDQAKVGNAG
ncbi:MAG: type II toxin-antitoxin system HicB family antitoxin [Trueperaceae bacterium]|jgi:predicted HicB family RNase H-like nuclease